MDDLAAKAVLLGLVETVFLVNTILWRNSFDIHTLLVINITKFNRFLIKLIASS